jgi:hypothetical protein
MRALPLLPRLAAAAVLALTLAAPALAAYGELDSPSVALPSEYPAAAREQVLKALKRPDCKFVDGHWLNSFTSLRYGGPTRALNLFMDDLAQCPGATVHVSLTHLGDGVAWRVSHQAWDNRFHIEVNLDSKQMKVEDLYLPAARGPEVKKEAKK